MEKKQYVGYRKYAPKLTEKVDHNQMELVDELLTPRPKLPERGGAINKIVSSYPAYNVEAQPVQARGRIVWSKAYSFQAKGPSYLEPVTEADTEAR